MKTAVSIPDRIYKKAESMAHRFRTSRSRLYSQALEEYVSRHDSDEITSAMNRVCDAVPQKRDPFLSAAARRLLAKTEW